MFERLLAYYDKTNVWGLIPYKLKDHRDQINFNFSQDLYDLSACGLIDEYFEVLSGMSNAVEKLDGHEFEKWYLTNMLNTLTNFMEV